MRTYGKTKTCAGCRFWSEMIAKGFGQGMQAVCLASAGPFKSGYVYDFQSCPEWQSGHHGAIDTPPGQGEHVRATYDAEDIKARKGTPC